MFTIVTPVVEVFAVLNGIFIWAFSNYLEANRPTHAVGAFTVEVQNHGASIFISQQENVVRVLSWPAFFILLVICVGLETSIRIEK